MAQHDVFSRRVRWLAIAVGLSAAALTCFLSPLAALVPALLPLAAALQPTLPDTGKRVVKWFTWAWALLWTPYLVGIGFLLLNNFPSHYSMILRVLSTVPALLILWWDIELIADGTRRIRIWRSAPAQEPRSVSWALWIFAAALNLWVGCGLAKVISVYHGDHGAGVLYMLVMSLVEALIVVAFDIYLTWRVVKLRRVSQLM
jgi:hypothetical protein